MAGDISEVKFRIRDCRVRWVVLIALTVLHVGAIAAPFFFTWDAFALAVALWIITGMLGITVGYHRLLAHRSFHTFRVVKWFHAFCATFAFQKGPISWVRTHRAHHANSDTDKDPHPQHHGFFFGHAGWMFLSHPIIGRSPEAKKKPNDLTSDPVIVFLEKHHLTLNLLSLLGLYLWGGLPYLLWGGCFRTVFFLHATWFVNSWGHQIGYRNFKTSDDSRNNPFVAGLTFGEGWHNNHHRFPSSARQGLRFFEIDPSWIWIWSLKQIGLVWAVKESKYKNPELASIPKPQSQRVA